MITAARELDGRSLQQGGNELLATLPATTLADMAPHCRRVAYGMGQTITAEGQPIAAALFVEEGIASIFKPAKPCSVEICLTGTEGLCGTPLVLGSDRWPYRTIVQTGQLTGVQVEAAALRRLVEGDATLRAVLLQAVHVKMVQIAEGLVSGTSQRLPERLARWLLMYRDRMCSNLLEVTHEFMALMVGAQRTGVTAALHELEGDGLLCCKRGQVLVRDIDGLRALAATSYGVPEREQARLFAPR